MKVAVIVPMYGTEKFVEECVAGIIGQTYKDLEIILIDDGSPDRVGEIADRLAASDERIKVIHIPNGGVGNARRVGIQSTDCEFSFFMDSDDCLAPDCIQKLVEAEEETGADMIYPTLLSFYPDGYKENAVHLLPKGYVSKDEYRRMFVTYLGAYAMIAGKFVRTEIVKEVKSCERRMNEDVYFIDELISKLNSIYNIGESLYYYRQRQSSIMHKDLAKMGRDLIAAVDSVYEHCEDDENLKKDAYKQCINTRLFYYRFFENDEKKKLSKELKEGKAYILKQNYYPLKRKLKYLIACTFPTIYGMIKGIKTNRHGYY